MTGLDQRVVLSPDDGSLGPLLRVADDRLAPGASYGHHEHRAIDVVAVVLSGTLRHLWGSGAHLQAGDVAVLRAGAGLDHDEIAGDDGVRVLQCYLRAAHPDAPPAHEVLPGPTGWIDLGRDDSRLWLARPGEGAEVPEGLRLVVTASGCEVAAPGRVITEEPAMVLVWQLDAARPEWARD